MINVKELFWLTIQRPAEAANLLHSYRFSRSVAWTTLGLAAVLNAAIFVAMLILAGEDPYAQALIELVPPLPFAAIYFLAAALSAIVLSWAGKILGGAGAFDAVLVFIAWLQIVRLVALICVSILTFVAPAFASLLNFVIWLYGIWIVVNFQNVTQGFESIGKSALCLFISFLALLTGITLLASLAGVGGNLG